MHMSKVAISMHKPYAIKQDCGLSTAHVILITIIYVMNDSFRLKNWVK